MEHLIPSITLRTALAWLPTCEPHSLDQLDRTVRLLVDTQDQMIIIAAWVIDPTRFVIVNETNLGHVGYVCATLAGDPNDYIRLASLIAGTSQSNVNDWENQGWQRQGVTWNADPKKIATPWEDNAEVSNLPRRFADRDATRWIAAPTVLTSYIVASGDPPLIPATRLLSGWVGAADAVVIIHAHANPEKGFTAPDDRDENLKQLHSALAPGQRYLRLGRFLAPHSSDAHPYPYSSEALGYLYSSVSEYETAFYPGALLADTHERWGIRWFTPMPERLDEEISRMAQIAQNV